MKIKEDARARLGAYNAQSELYSRVRGMGRLWYWRHPDLRVVIPNATVFDVRPIPITKDKPHLLADPLCWRVHTTAVGDGALHYESLSIFVPEEVIDDIFSRNFGDLYSSEKK